MNGRREENSSRCFHPKESVVGVCPFCLNERLLVLALKQSNHRSYPPPRLYSASSTERNNQRFQDFTQKKTPISLPKIFSFSSFLNGFELRHSKSDHPDDHDASNCQEDSFISIKFGDNGTASWEKGKVSKVSLEHCRVSWNHHIMMTKDLSKGTSKTMVEHQKPRVLLRWRKQIGHLFQLIGLKRPSACHVGTKVEGFNVSKYGKRPLTKKAKI